MLNKNYAKSQPISNIIKDSPESSISYDVMTTIVGREVMWLQKLINSQSKKKIAIFGAGATARNFYYRLLNNFGIDADIFIDNNPKYENCTACGKPIVRNPWCENPNYKNDYFVIIATSVRKYLYQIEQQLNNAGIIAYITHNAFITCHYWERYKIVASCLDSDYSRLSYLASIYFLLTNDNQFIQYESNSYFAMLEFVNCSSEIVVDAGAFVGDTTEEFIKRGADEGVKVYAFEPFDNALSALEERKSRLVREWLISEDDIIVIPAGLGAKTQNMEFSMGNAIMLKTSEGGDREVQSSSLLQIYSLDDYFLEKAAFTVLKADIEGSEMDMLYGAKKIIKQNKPKISICIYHSPEDFYRIAEYIHRLVPEYKLAVRNHHCDHRETVLYCWI